MEKNYSEAELAYLAGFLDADGAIIAIIEKHPEKLFKHRVRVTLKITQKNSQILKYFQNIYKIGTI